MAILTIAAASAILSQPIKDLYSSGKEKFEDSLSKWSNNRAVSALSKKVAAYEKVKTIWQRDKEVNLTSFYYPSKVTFHSQLTKKVSSLKDLPKTGSLVIQGTVGQGKSIFLRYLCIQELRSQSSGRIPVLMELRKLDSKTTLKEMVFSTLENLGFEVSDDLFDFYADSGKLVLLLDGFDELNESQIMPVVTQLESWAERYPSFQIIVSSRPGGEIQKSSHFSVVKLAPIEIDDLKPFLSKIGVKGKQLENLLQAVEQSPSQIKEFLRTPLLLTLLTMVYRTDGTIPAELPEFFQILFTTVFSKHDGTKPGFKRRRHTELNDHSLELLFEGFCFAVMRNNFGVNLNEEQFTKAFEDAIKYRNENCDHSAFRHDLVKVACLLLEDGFNLSFAHKSLLEYYCASFIKHSTEKQAEQIYKCIKTQPQWRPVLSYANHIDKYKYTKFFAIPKLKQTFEILGFGFNEITPDNIEKTLIAFFGNAEANFYLNKETGKYTQNGISGYGGDETIYLEQMFYNLINIVVILVEGEWTLDEINLKFPNKLKVEKGEREVITFLWMDIVPTDKKKEIVVKISEQLQSLSDQYTKMIEYLKIEDDKANEYSMFEVD